MSNSKKVLVTGSCGFIGHHLVKALKDKGYYVIGVDDLSNGDIEYSTLSDEFLDMSILDLSATVLFGVSYIFHLAALPRVSYSLEYPVKTHNVNVNGTLHLLELAKDMYIEKFIYSSSSSAYGEQEILPVNETMATNPMSPYAIQKLTGEMYAEVYREAYGLQTASLRYFNVYGEDQDGAHPYATVVAKFLDQKASGIPLTIHGDGEQTRDMTYVQDVAQANILAAESDAVGVFNIGGGHSYSVNEVAEMIGGETTSHPPRGNEPRDTLADITKAKEVLGWEPSTKLHKWINTQ